MTSAARKHDFDHGPERENDVVAEPQRRSHLRIVSPLRPEKAKIGRAHV